MFALPLSITFPLASACELVMLETVPVYTVGKVVESVVNQVVSLQAVPLSLMAYALTQYVVAGSSCAPTVRMQTPSL